MKMLLAPAFVSLLMLTNCTVAPEAAQSGPIGGLAEIAGEAYGAGSPLGEGERPDWGVFGPPGERPDRFGPRELDRLLDQLERLSADTPSEDFDLVRHPESDLDGDGVLSDDEWLASLEVFSTEGGCASITDDFSGLGDECGQDRTATVTWTAVDADGIVLECSSTFTILASHRTLYIKHVNGQGPCPPRVSLILAALPTRQPHPGC